MHYLHGNNKYNNITSSTRKDNAAQDFLVRLTDSLIRNKNKYNDPNFHKRCEEYAIKNGNYQVRVVATK